MKSMRAVAIGIVVSVALVCAALGTAKQQQDATPPAPDSVQIGVGLARTIVTAEVIYSTQHHAFADWDTLYNSPDVQKSWQLMHISAGPEVVPGWTISLVASAHGTHFQVSLHNSASKSGLSVFSSDNGIVYEAGWVDCVQLTPRAQE